MFTLTKNLSILLVTLVFLLGASFPSEVHADVCNITNVRLGGQPGDAYVGPTCNDDGTYRTCFYISGQDLPADNPSYQVKINGVIYPVAFTVALSSTQVVICVTGVPGDATPNVDVFVQLASGCTFTALDLFTEPNCSCGITGVRVGGQPGDAYIGPTCNDDGTYRTCFYISGQFLPADNPSYQVKINGVIYPVAFTVALSSTQVVICVTGVPGDATPNVDVFVQLASGCTFTALDLFTEPNCSCGITGVRLGGQPGDAYIGPTCNGDGTYRTCFYISGQFLPANNADYQVVIDGVEYPIAFVVALSLQEVVICVTGIPADGTQGVPVFIQLKEDCHFSVCPFYNEPTSCPGGSFPADPFPGPWSAADINTANGNAMFNPCNITNFIISASGFPTPTSDKQHSIYRDICGDAEMVAHISSISNPGWAGIEIRENLTPGAKKAAIKTQLSNFVRRDVRALQNGFNQSFQLFRPLATWLKLVRSGNNFQGFTSANGQNWQFAFSVDIQMASCIKVGMFVESINVNTVTTAVFDNVTVLGSAPVMLPFPEPGAFTTTEYPSEKLPDFGLFPNPAKEEVNIDLAYFLGQEVTISLFSIEGRLLKTQRIEEVQKTIEQFQLHGFEDGAYLLKVNSGSESLTKKLFIAGR